MRRKNSAFIIAAAMILACTACASGGSDKDKTSATSAVNTTSDNAADTSEAAKQTTEAVQQTDKETTSTAEPGSEQHETKIVWVREDPADTGEIDLYEGENTGRVFHVKFDADVISPRYDDSYRELDTYTTDMFFDIKGYDGAQMELKFLTGWPFATAKANIEAGTVEFAKIKEVGGFETIVGEVEYIASFEFREDNLLITDNQREQLAERIRQAIESGEITNISEEDIIRYSYMEVTRREDVTVYIRFYDADAMSREEKEAIAAKVFLELTVQFVF